MNAEDQATIRLLQISVAQNGTAIEGMRQAIAKLPEEFRSIMREHREDCEARKGFVELAKETAEVTGVVDVMKQRVLSQKEKISFPPQKKAPWWIPIFLKFVLPAVGIGAAGGTAFGSWGLHCSTNKSIIENPSR